ncbi:hypothetical protein RB195_023200 [Necator americanus]|uniref:Uncharacterized protein n=1 Tax=Necator americanus TaxID=51031 RepID=A0ABR1EI80_NECAM
MLCIQLLDEVFVVDFHRSRSLYASLQIRKKTCDTDSFAKYTKEAAEKTSPVLTPLKKLLFLNVPPEALAISARKVSEKEFASSTATGPQERVNIKSKQMFVFSKHPVGIFADIQPIELVDEFCCLGCMLYVGTMAATKKVFSTDAPRPLLHSSP